MLNNAKQYIGFDMDYTISVQEAGYFKPHWKTYSLAVLKTKTKKENVKSSERKISSDKKFSRGSDV